jgi:hypothetical protein
VGISLSPGKLTVSVSLMGLVVSHPSCDQEERDRRRKAFAKTNQKRATTKGRGMSFSMGVTSCGEDNGRGEVKRSWAYPIRDRAATEQSCDSEGIYLSQAVRILLTCPFDD